MELAPLIFLFAFCGEKLREKKTKVSKILSTQNVMVKLSHLHVFPETGRVGVGLVAPSDFAIVRLVRRVDVAVLLPVARVGETSVATVEIALERLLT